MKRVQQIIKRYVLHRQLRSQLKNQLIQSRPNVDGSIQHRTWPIKTHKHKLGIRIQSTIQNNDKKINMATVGDEHFKLIQETQTLH